MSESTTWMQMSVGRNVPFLLADLLFCSSFHSCSCWRQRVSRAMMSFRQMSMGFLMHDLPVAIGATSTFISVASISELSAYSSLTPPIRVAQAGNMALAIAGRQ